ncbi:MAG: hypothetical protein ACYC2O_05370 [Microthrixaceae bacterium]
MIARDAPVSLRRAASIALAVGRAIDAHPGAVGPTGVLRSGEVVLHADGSVGLPPPVRTNLTAAETAATPSTAAGAAIGRLLFELLIGRPPLGRADALEPALVEALAPPDLALLARSCSDAEGQWPGHPQWQQVLSRLAGGQATDPSPAEHAASRRRQALVVLGLLVLVAATVLVVLLAPGWWDAANAQG